MYYFAFGYWEEDDLNTVLLTEKNAWDKYQKIIVCNHEMERRDRKDGYGYCKHCSYSSMVFEPLTRCCKCGIPTNYCSDYKNNFYCKIKLIRLNCSKKKKYKNNNK